VSTRDTGKRMPSGGAHAGRGSAVCRRNFRRATPTFTGRLFPAFFPEKSVVIRGSTVDRGRANFSRDKAMIVSLRPAGTLNGDKPNRGPAALPHRALRLSGASRTVANGCGVRNFQGSPDSVPLVSIEQTAFATGLRHVARHEACLPPARWQRSHAVSVMVSCPSQQPDFAQARAYVSMPTGSGCQ
jgi:hypothetical protein